MLTNGAIALLTKDTKTSEVLKTSEVCCPRTVLLLRYIPKFNSAAMASNHLLEIERAIASLSAKEKLWLLERIAHQLREPDEAELSEMANDPEIQAEITAINQEFALTEMDGLLEDRDRPSYHPKTSEVLKTSEV